MTFVVVKFLILQVQGLYNNHIIFWVHLQSKNISWNSLILISFLTAISGLCLWSKGKSCLLLLIVTKPLLASTYLCFWLYFMLAACLLLQGSTCLFVYGSLFETYLLPAALSSCSCKGLFFQSTWVNLLSVYGEYWEGCIILYIMS